MQREVWSALKGSKSCDVYHTHVSLFGPPGKFCLERQKIEIFWQNYCSGLQLHKRNFVCGTAEKPQHYLPVLVDVDISQSDFEEDSEKPLPWLYKRVHVERLVECYQRILKKIIDEVEDVHLTCIFLQKDPYLSKKADGTSLLKNGFHLHFPYVFLNKIEQETHLIPRVKDLVGKEKIFEDAGFPDSASLLDTSYCTVPWLCYGSSKAQGKEPYLVEDVFDHNGCSLSLAESLSEYKIYDSQEQEIDKVENIEFYLPRILSIIPYGRDICDLKSGLPSPLEPVRKKQRKRISYEPDVKFQENVKKYRTLVNMLCDSRAQIRNQWIEVGWILYNIGNGCDEARDIWLEFSQRCADKYDETTCLTLWDRMVKMDKGEGSLRHYAAADNPQAYEAFRSANVQEHVKESLNGSHYDIAKALYEMYGTEFVCSSLRHQTWFYYKCHRWLEMELGVFLRKKISTEILSQYAKLMHEIVDKLAKAEDAGEKAMYEARFKQLTKLIGSLKNSSFKTNIMKEAAEVFYDPGFAKKLNQNPYLVGFKNGVYDTRTHVMRDGSPDDYISLQAAVEYKEFEETDKEVGQVLEFLEKVFPDRSVREYFMDVASDVFVGGNHHKLVQVWSGEGDNAKSVTQTLFEKMLGGYAVKLPTSLIVGKRTQSSAACPELVRAGGGVRFAVLQEPDQKDVINIGILKELSGNDTFFARTLFKEGGEITPMFKLILICNEPPQLPYGDKAVWNRIRVIPFESTFADENSDEPPPKEYAEQLRQKRFPKDKAFIDKIPGMIEAFAYLLLEHRKIEKRRIEPEKVRLATEGYRKKNDIYRQYVEESIVSIENLSSSLPLGELYSSFKIWFKEALPNHQIPVKQDVLTYFTKAWGEPTIGIKWKGKRLRTLRDDVQDGDAIVIDIPQGASLSTAEERVPL